MDSTSVVLITGAGSGIGEATARAFARQGAALVLADVAAAQLRAIEQAIREDGGTVLGVVTDVRDDASVRALIAAGVERFGGFDTVCANAGVAFPEAPLVDTSDDVLDSLLDVNVRGTIYLLRAAIPHVRPGGAIMLTASTSGLQGHPGAAVYAATKIALIGLGRSLALEVAPRRIRVNMICPGGVDTPLLRRVYGPELDVAAAGAAVPLGRLAAPEDIAAGIVFLSSPAAHHITGVALRVDGGDGLFGAL